MESGAILNTAVATVEETIVRPLGHKKAVADRNGKRRESSFIEVYAEQSVKKARLASSKIKGQLLMSSIKTKSAQVMELEKSITSILSSNPNEPFLVVLKKRHSEEVAALKELESKIQIVLSEVENITKTAVPSSSKVRSG